MVNIWLGQVCRGLQILNTQWISSFGRLILNTRYCEFILSGVLSYLSSSFDILVSLSQWMFSSLMSALFYEPASPGHAHKYEEQTHLVKMHSVCVTSSDALWCLISFKLTFAKENGSFFSPSSDAENENPNSAVFSPRTVSGSFTKQIGLLQYIYLPSY